jgi:transposase
MRGTDSNQPAMFCYLSLEEMLPEDHPLRGVRELTDEALERMSKRFEQLYSRIGRPSIAPEKLLRAMVLQFLYSVRSERLLVERMRYDLSFRWFVGLNLEDEAWDATVFSKNRTRLLEGKVADEFLAAVVEGLKARDWLSNEHFSVDGTLVEAWASQKSFQRKSKAPARGSGARGKVLLKDLFESRTDPDARKFKKSKFGETKLCHLAHAVMENRHGLVVAACVTEANTGKEREAAWEMLGEVQQKKKRITLGADKGYDDFALVAKLRSARITPHIAQYQRRTSSLDKRTTRHAGYWISLWRRARVENVFSWIKNIAGLRKVKLRGRERVDWVFKFAVATYNLVRARNLREQYA